MKNKYDRYKKSLSFNDIEYVYYDVRQVCDDRGVDAGCLPYTIRVLLENAVRNYDGKLVTDKHIEELVHWVEISNKENEVPFIPARVILQDFTGVPAVVDLAAMRDAVREGGISPDAINPQVPVDLVIDHSVMVDVSGSEDALQMNMDREYARNRERYEFLKWAGESFDRFRVVPPGTGIIHQVNLEYLANVVMAEEREDGHLLYPDSLVGTDSHTTMINGLGVLGWGVGGIEAEAGMLGQPIYLVSPEVSVSS